MNKIALTWATMVTIAVVYLLAKVYQLAENCL